MDEPQPAYTAGSIKSALLKQDRVFAAILGLLLLAELVLQLSLRKGWAAYAGLDAVKAIAVDGHGQVWATGYRQDAESLMTYPDHGKPIQVPLPSELMLASTSALMIDRQDRVWVGTDRGIIGMRDVNSEWILYTSSGDYSVWAIVMDGQGQVWARSHRGPGRIDPEAGDKTYTFMNSGLAGSDAVAIATDPKGQLWVLTTKRELKVLEPDGSWRTYTIVPNSVRNSIFGSHLAFDQQGQIWLATSDGVGVLSANGIGNPYPLGAISIGAILPDADGRVWVAADIQGLFMFDPKTGWTNYTSGNSGLRSNVNALALDEQGQVWIGSSQGGLRKFDPDNALPVQILPAVSLAAGAIVPAAFLSISLLAALAIAFSRPGATSSRNIRDFSIAFAGWFIINGLLWGFIRFSHEQSGGLLFINPLVCVPLPVNILAMMLLYRWRRRMALGALAAFMANWIGLIFVTPVADQSLLSSLYRAIFMIPFFFPFILA